MCRSILAIVFCTLTFVPTTAQEKTVWGSLSGKITDEKTKKPLADAIVFLKAPNGGFPIHADDKVRKDLVIQIPPGRTFNFRMLAAYPYFVAGDKKVSTGQKVLLVGDSLQSHVIRIDLLSPLAVDDESRTLIKKAFERGDLDRGGLGRMNLLPAGEKTTLKLDFLAGYSLQSLTYAGMKTHIMCLNHPYYAITQKDGSYIIPRIPAGSEVIVWAWQEDVGYLLTRNGRKMTPRQGKNVLDVEVKNK